MSEKTTSLLLLALFLTLLFFGFRFGVTGIRGGSIRRVESRRYFGSDGGPFFGGDGVPCISVGLL
jgi:hypothetical protein